MLYGVVVQLRDVNRVSDRADVARMVEPAQQIVIDVGRVDVEDPAHLLRPLGPASAKVVRPVPDACKALRVDEARVRFGELRDVLLFDAPVCAVHAASQPRGMPG